MRLRSIVGAAGLATLLLAPAVALTAPASAAPAPTAPTAPQSATIEPGHGGATVTWSAPASNGGAPITAYRIRVAPGDRTVTVAAPATSTTITGLADGTQVTASVVAINPAGTSPAADAGSTIPTPPTTTIAEGAPGQYEDMAVAADGTTYLATDDAILEISADGATTTPLPVGAVQPWAVAVAPDGDVYWSENSSNGDGVVRRLHEGVVERVAGDDNVTGPQTGPVAGPVPALDAQLVAPLDLAISPVDGSIFVVDYLCSVVQQFTVGGTLQVVAGTPGDCSDGSFSGDGGPATSAHLKGPQGVAVDDDGAVYIADTWNDRVRRFTVGGTIATVAGNGTTELDMGHDLLATGTATPMPAALAWSPDRGLLIDSFGRERMLVGDRLLRIGDDAFDAALYETTAPAGGGPIVPSKENTRALAWSGSTLKALLVVRDGTGWKAALKAVGPWLPATDPTEHPGFGSWTDLVTLHHRAIVDRAPTAGELETWVAALDAGTKTPGQLDDALRRSPENTANVDPVVRLYRAFLGRAPDAGGLRFWIGRKRNVAPARTWSVSQMAASFVASGEFQRKYGSLTNRAFVTRIYTDVLGRPADPSGVDFWTKRLDTKRMTRAQVMVGFSESSEYRRKQAANTDVAIAYLALVGRMPTVDETTAWTTASAGGATHVELLDQLVKAAPALI